MAMLLQPDVYFGEQKARTQDKQATEVTRPVTLNAFNEDDDDNSQPVTESPQMLDARENRRVSEEFADAQPVCVLSLAECAEPHI